MQHKELIVLVICMKPWVLDVTLVLCWNIFTSDQSFSRDGTSSPMSCFDEMDHALTIILGEIPYGITASLASEISV